MSTTKGLSELYSCLNREFWSGELPPVAFTTSFAKQRITWGILFTPQCRISVHYKLLKSKQEDLYMNMLHQMIHVKNKINDIKDTSHADRYHNKKFADEAKKVGLLLDYNKLTGHNVVGISDEAVSKINKIFNYQQYLKEVEENEVPEKWNMYTYRCPKCNRVVNAFSTNKIICGYCYCEYIFVKQTEEDNVFGLNMDCR